MRRRGQRPDGSSAGACGKTPRRQGAGTECQRRPNVAKLTRPRPARRVAVGCFATRAPALCRAARFSGGLRIDGSAAAEDHRQPLRRAQPAGDAGAARRRPGSAVVRTRDRDRRPHLARAEGARGAGAGRAGARLRAERHRLHRQRAARAPRSPRAWSARSRTAATRCTTRWRVWRHQRRSNRAQHRLPLRRLERVLSPLARPAAWSTPARISATDDDTLDDAQTPKLEHICRKLRLAPGERFLDIGCGWGGAAVPGGRSATASTRPASRCRRTSSNT